MARPVSIHAQFKASLDRPRHVALGKFKEYVRRVNDTLVKFFSFVIIEEVALYGTRTVDNILLRQQAEEIEKVATLLHERVACLVDIAVPVGHFCQKRIPVLSDSDHLDGADLRQQCR